MSGSVSYHAGLSAEDQVARDYQRRGYPVTAHRWRYALPEEPLSERCVVDGDRKLGVCGDWCGGPRVEGAFLSGLALAESLLAAN